MFDAICIRRQQHRRAPIDLGFLAEAMTFYRDVHVVADRETFSYLVRVCGPDSLFAALDQGFLKMSYLENKLGVSTIDQSKPTERYGLHFLTYPKHEFLSLAEGQFFELTGKVGRSRRLANRFAKCVTTVRWGKAEAQAAKDDLLNSEIMDTAAKIILQDLAPGVEMPNEGIFRVVQSPNALLVETNLALAEAGRQFNRLNPDSYLGIETILGTMFEALADLRFSANFCSELAVSARTSAIAEIKLAQLLRERRKSDEELKLFQEWTFKEGRAIRDAVNRGHRSFDDILRLVASATRFKQWLAKQPDTTDVRQEYLREISRVEWAEKLPAKSFRWLLFSALGVALGSPPATAVITGAALNAIDALIADRLAKGWRPNQFVEGPLRAFVKRSADARGLFPG